MKRIFLITLFVIFSTALFSQSVYEKADSLFKLRKDPQNSQKAISILEENLKKNPNDYNTLWRLSRLYYFLGYHLEGKVKKNIIKSYYEKAMNYGKKAIAVNPEGVEGHFWLGVGYGKYGEVRGVLKSLFLVGPIKDEMKKVIELDEKYDCGGAYRVLGRLYFKLPGIAGGDKKKSLMYLKKSKEICPDNPLTRIYLADTLRKLKRKKEAREELEWVLNSKFPEDEEPEREIYLREAKEIYKKVK